MTMAARRGQTGEETLSERTAHEQILHHLRLAKSRLSGIQSNITKAEIKKELLPEFSAWIDGTIEGDSGRPDDVITTMMVWAVDCGDIPLALRIGAYVVRHNLTMPDNFGRSAATVLTEEICSPVLTLATTDPDAELSAFTDPLDSLWDIVRGSDMPDQVRAKLCKARAFSRRASADPETQGEALKLLREAMHLDKNAGVKREIAALTRALKKVPATDDADSDQDNTAATDNAAAQPEKKPARTTTRKSGTDRTTRKTTAGKTSPRKPANQKQS